MRRGWRAKAAADVLPDESERAEHSRFLLSAYRAKSYAPSWEWTVRTSYLAPPIAWGGGDTEDEAQRLAEEWLKRALRARAASKQAGAAQ